MARGGNRAIASLSGHLLARRTSRAAFRMVSMQDGEADKAATEPAIASMSDQMAQIADLIAKPSVLPVGPIDRTGRTLSLRLDGERHHKLQMAARVSGLSQQQLVLAAIDLWLSARKSRPTSPLAGQ